jgi:hypothetical protein
LNTPPAARITDLARESIISCGGFPVKRFLTAIAVALSICGTAGFVGAADAGDANAVVDKAIEAMGGAEKLGKVHATHVKTKGTITIEGNQSPFTGQSTVKGFDHYHLEFGLEIGGNKVEGATVINGDKGWRKFADNVMPVEGDALKGEKRGLYLQIAAGNPSVLKGNGFKLSKTTNDNLDGKPVVGVEITGPDGKDFTIFFDKESGLPAKFVAKVMGFMGEEVKQETTFSNYKDFAGIKKATKTVTKRDGEPFLSQELVEFKVLDTVAPKLFEEPK